MVWWKVRLGCVGARGRLMDRHEDGPAVLHRQLLDGRSRTGGSGCVEVRRFRRKNRSPMKDFRQHSLWVNLRILTFGCTSFTVPGWPQFGLMHTHTYMFAYMHIHTCKHTDIHCVDIYIPHGVSHSRGRTKTQKNSGCRYLCGFFCEGIVGSDSWWGVFWFYCRSSREMDGNAQKGGILSVVT